MHSFTLKPSTLSGTIKAPPSKSHTLRAILFASMAHGTSKIRHYLKSPDTSAMIDACRQLGAITQVNGELIEITGCSGKPRLPDDVINAGNSGQVLRFIASIAALIDGHTVLTGDHSVRFNRPMKPLMDGLTHLGAHCIATKSDGHAPLVIKGPIAPGITTLDGPDSQPVSGLLIASAFLSGTTTINVINPGEKPWVALTLTWFDRLGIPYTNDRFESYTVEGGQSIQSFDYSVPGDFSAMAYPLIAAIITQSSLSITHIDMMDAQGDKAIIEALLKMGAKITIDNNTLTVTPGDTLIGSDIDVNAMIDALPILAVAACFAKGTTRLLNAGIARKKESDRLSTISSELKAMGASIVEHDDSLTIVGAPLHGANLQSHHDHRIAMSLVVAGLAAHASTVVNHVACIAKSYPGFYEAMSSIGAAIEAKACT